jgi:RNA polymerase sigma-70 factor (ECF subfamily)
MAESTSNNWISGQGFGIAQIKSIPEVQTTPELRKLDEELSAIIGRIARAQEDALAEFYDATAPVALGLVLRIVGDKEIAEEVLLQVYEQVWQQSGSFDRSKGNPLTWLGSIARTSALAGLRSHSPTQPTGITRNLNDSKVVVGDAFMPEVRTEVRRAMAQIPTEEREVIELAYFGGLSQCEIAAKLNRTEMAVRIQMRNGMTKLRELFD